MSGAFSALYRNPAPARTAVKPLGAAMAWMYILQCADGSYYVGSTTDLERRLFEHEEGEGCFEGRAEDSSATG